jgi:hypothetical protein
VSWSETDHELADVDAEFTGGIEVPEFVKTDRHPDNESDEENPENRQHYIHVSKGTREV